MMRENQSGWRAEMTAVCPSWFKSFQFVTCKEFEKDTKLRIRYLFRDESSQTSTLFDRIGYSLVDRRIQNLFIIVFKTINNYPREYLRDPFR